MANNVITTAAPMPADELHGPLEYDLYVEKQFGVVAALVLALLGVEEILESQKQLRPF